MVQGAQQGHLTAHQQKCWPRVTLDVEKMAGLSRESTTYCQITVLPHLHWGFKFIIYVILHMTENSVAYGRVQEKNWEKTGNKSVSFQAHHFSKHFFTVTPHEQWHRPSFLPLLRLTIKASNTTRWWHPFLRGKCSWFIADFIRNCPV